MAGKSKRNNEDNIPEGLDDLLNELTGNKNNKEDSIPEGLDDLLNEIKGKKKTATKPKRKRGRPRKKKTSPPGALTKYSKTEDVDSRILELLGLEYTFDLDYDDYANLLKEKLIEVSKGTGDSSTEDSMLLREELKKARANKGKGTFKVKKKISKDSFTNFNVGGPKKDTAQRRKPAYALLQGKEIAEKTQRVNDLKEEKKERKQSDNQILKSISKSLDRIIGILSKQLKFDKDQAEKQRKLEERGKRKDKENKMESAFSKGIKALAKVAGKIFSPLQDFFGKIIRFFTVIFLGKVVKKFLEWFTDPKNESKIKTIGRLLKTFWPAILAGLVFLNPLGRLITKAVFVIGKGVARLLKVAIPSLLKFGMRNPIVAAALAAAGLFTFGAWGPKVIPGLTNDEEDDGDEVKSYKRGGKVTTESGKDIRGAGVDTQLIAARPGEIVINKETVNAVGADYLLGLNRQYGGANANKPKTAKVQAASGGGLVVSAFSGGGPVGEERKEKSNRHRPRKPNQIIERYILGDKSLLNQAALGNYDEVLKILGLNNDNEPSKAAAKTYNEEEKSKGKYNPLYNIGEHLTNFSKNPYIGEEGIDKLTKERIASGELGEDGLGLTKTTQKNLDEHDAYIRGLYNPEKDTGFMGGLKKINQDIQNKGLIADPLAALGLKEEGTEKFVEKITGGRVKNLGAKLTGLQFAVKGLAGPFGRMFQIDDRGSLGRYLRPAMEYAQSQGHTSVGSEAPGFGQKKYDELVNDKLANLALGQVHFEVDEQGRAKTSDVFDASRMTPKQYLEASRKALGDAGNMLMGKEVLDAKGNAVQGGPVGIAKALYQSAFMGLSGRLATAQNSGFGNLRPMGLDIDLGGGFTPTKTSSPEKPKLTAQQIKNNQAYAASKGKYYSSTTGKTYENYAAALKDPAVAAADAAAKKAQHSRRMAMAKLMNNNSAGLYYSSTTGKTYANYAEALKDPQVAAAAELEKTKQRFSLSKTPQAISPSKPSMALTLPSQTTAPPSQTTAPSKPKRWAMDPRGWFGMEGGGFIKENTGMNIPGGGTDRQRINAQPGEYVLPVDAVMKMGGRRKIDRMVANLDSNSTPAKMGLRNKDISEGITPYNTEGSGEIDIETLPLSGLGGGNSPVLNSGGGTQDEFFSPISSAGLSERQRYMDTIGISAFT